jgi:hypothetical protein
MINFFASAAAAEAYLRAHPTVTGQLLSPAAAAEAGRRVFGVAGALSACVERGDACCEASCTCEAAE